MNLELLTLTQWVMNLVLKLNESIGQPDNQSINQPVSWPVGESVSQLVRWVGM